MLSIGVKDSKKLEDQRILSMAAELKDLIDYECISLMPIEYNYIYSQEKNLNRIMMKLHKDAHQAVLKRNGQAVKGCIIDQYTSRTQDLEIAMRSFAIPIVQRPKAEQYLPVACASILARADFIEGIASLSERFSLDLPKGASSHVEDVASEFLEDKGEEVLAEVAKLHFATSKKIGL